MLMFTNRKIDNGGFGRAFAPGKDLLSFGDASQTSGGTWRLKGLTTETDDDAALAALLAVFRGRRPVLIYLHGNNNTPQACFERCALLASMYPVEAIGFSWPSEGYQADGDELADAPNATPGKEDDLDGVKAGNRTKHSIQSKIQRYHQAQMNAQHSVDALARFLRLVAAARLQANGQPFSLAAHSLGAYLLQYSLEIETARESLGSAFNVALLAACVRAPGHKEWLARLRPKERVFVTYNNEDSVLLGAFIADGSQAFKLGADPGPDRLVNGLVRYVDFSHSKVGLGGHAYFVYDKLLKTTRLLFTRMFGSERDVQANEDPFKVYQLGCDADRLTCYIGTSPQTESGGG